MILPVTRLIIRPAGSSAGSDSGHSRGVGPAQVPYYAVVLLALVVAGTVIRVVYKRLMDPVHAKESLDSSVWLLQISRYLQSMLSFDRAIDLKPNLRRLIDVR